jgi:hypothetical protein
MSCDLSGFMDLWEIEPHFKCPVVGAMLSVEKHGAILKKCGYDISQLKPYEYHQKIMMKLSDRNSVSVKVNNYIKSCARKCMVQIAQAGAEGSRQLWDEYKKTGHVGPMMFAIVSYRDSDVELLCDVYGEVHMLTHANMTKVFDLRKKLLKTNESLSKEKQKVCEKTGEIKELIKLRKTSATKITQLENENRKLAGQIKNLEKQTYLNSNFDTIVIDLKEKVAQLELKLESANDKFNCVEREKRKFQLQAFSLGNENETLQNELTSLVENFGAFASHNNESENTSVCPCEKSGCMHDACERYQLCAKRVFMIGGITKMKAYYKDIIEKAGGKFDYHDGYIKNTTSNLEARVKRSDLVLCPVNCNSHTACLKVKQLCMRYNTELKILSSSSLSAVSNAILVPDSENQMILN